MTIAAFWQPGEQSDLSAVAQRAKAESVPTLSTGKKWWARRKRTFAHPTKLS